MGAGAAGLMTAIACGRRPGVVVLDGARTLGAKILVAGGGRCNVTHDLVDESAFSGSTPAAIRKVLRRFGVDDTIDWFRRHGVPLKREEGGKLFPVDDRARSVLDALLGAARSAGAELRHPCRVETVERSETGFVLGGEWGTLRARRVVLATGGRSLPKSGSDGHGHVLARSLGHSITPLVVPALVPLAVPVGHFARGLAGVTIPARLEVQSTTGRRLAAFTGSTLFTHFGLSGPAVLDVSRHWLHAVDDDPAARLVASWLPGTSAESADAALRAPGRQGAGAWLARQVPERLARALCAEAGVDPAMPAARLDRARRRALVEAATTMVVPVTGHRGWAVAEVTAGGVPLSEVRLDTLESRACPGLHLVGEVLDVDGRIGGYNFQWAWASGHVAGAALRPPAAGLSR